MSDKVNNSSSLHHDIFFFVHQASKEIYNRTKQVAVTPNSMVAFGLEPVYL